MAPHHHHQLIMWGAFIIVSTLLNSFFSLVDADEKGLKVIWYAPFYSGGGYSSEASSFLEALHHHKVSVKVQQHGDHHNWDHLRGLHDSHMQLLHQYSYNMIWPQDSIVVCHSEPGAWHPSKTYFTSDCPPSTARYKVGRTMFETDRLPKGWEEKLNNMDEIWVPTAFHREIFIQGGVIPSKIQVLAEPVDVAFFNPRLSSPSPPQLLPAPTPQTYTFVSIFKWEDRKGWDVLLKAYFQEFNREKDDVRLVLLTKPYHSSKDFEKPVKTLVRKAFRKLTYPQDFPPVQIMTNLTTTELRGLYKASNCFVLPSRGEGWGRPHVEAMSMSLPIIATNWSGPTEYMTGINSYPLRYDGFSEIKDGAFKGHQWAEPSLTHLQELMRHVYTHREEAEAKGRAARVDMMTSYNPEILGEQLVDMLWRIEWQLRDASSSAAAGGGEGENDILDLDLMDTTRSAQTDL